MRRNQLVTRSLLVAGLLLGAPWMMAGHDKGNVDELRFGTAVNTEGVVPAENHAKHFVPDKAIHVTMQVQEAPEGTDLMLSIVDRETDELVWSAKQAVPGGHASMHFVVQGGDLDPGKYRAKVKLGNDWVAEHEFKIE